MTDYNFDLIKQEVKIVDYAKDIGLTPIKVGSKYYTLKEHDSVRINPDKNIFIQNSTGRSGSVIDFALTFTYMILKDVLEDLN